MVMERFYRDPRTLARMGEGALGPFVCAFAEQLSEQGYTRGSARLSLRLVANFSRWIERRGVVVQTLAPEDIGRYLKYRRAHQLPRSEDAGILTRFLTLLVDRGVVAKKKASTPTPAHEFEEEFRQYLQQERGLAPATIGNYLPMVRRFLVQLYGCGEMQLGQLRAADVIRFVQIEAARLRPKRAKLMTTALRSLLQYARYRGLITVDLPASIPTVAIWSMASIPKTLSLAEVRQLLAQCDRNTAKGCRDYAILLLLARLGLRGGEVAELTLDDLDWEAGELRIRSTGQRCDRLPLPQDVGAAIVDYLRHARPTCSSRQVFLRARAPRRRLVGPCAIGDVVRAALQRAGLDPPLKGSHLLRHSLATQMLNRGASLAEIGELLRHRCQQTTTIYAKVDLASLRPLALPWPGGVR
jgi:integrase/recombinase XerD